MDKIGKGGAGKLLIFFYTPWKHSKTSVFLMFSRALERDQWYVVKGILQNQERWNTEQRNTLEQWRNNGTPAEHPGMPPEH